MSLSPAPSPSDSPGPRLRRVLLVGKTGVDGTLRLDPGLDLVRCQGLGQAMAELTLAAGDHVADRSLEGVTIVIASVVWRETETARREGFVTHARNVYPGVRMVILHESGEKGSHAFTAPQSGVDVVFMASSGGDDIRAAIHGTSAREPVPTPVGSPGGAPATPSPPQAGGASIARPSVVVAGRIGTPMPAEPQRESDSILVAKLLQGEELGQAALSLLRERVHDASVEFLTHDQAQQVSHVPFAGAQCPVVWSAGTSGAASYGVLRATRTPLDALAPQAQWLAGWLRVYDQQVQLREAAFTDPLTKAWNRRYFDRFMESALARARESRHFVTVLIFDIDNFKQYNDRYGHEAGDAILVQTCDLMRSVIRPTDRVCRMGGDEFIVIFDEPEGSRQGGSRHPTSVFDIAHRFQRQIVAHRFPKLSEPGDTQLTISGGLATFPWDGQTATELLLRADQLLLESKRQGKNVITFGSGGQRLDSQ